MRQSAIGHWLAMSYPPAIVAWEQLKIQRDNGTDPALETRQGRNTQREAVEQQRVFDKEAAYTLNDVMLNGAVIEGKWRRSGRHD